MNSSAAVRPINTSILPPSSPFWALQFHGLNHNLSAEERRPTDLPEESLDESGSNCSDKRRGSACMPPFGMTGVWNLRSFGQCSGLCPYVMIDSGEPICSSVLHLYVVFSCNPCPAISLPLPDNLQLTLSFKPSEIFSKLIAQHFNKSLVFLKTLQ